MRRSHTVQPGEDFQQISIQAYGTLTGAARIASANPGVFEPLAPGTVLVVPPPPSPAPASAPVDPAAPVTLDVAGAEFRNWESVQFTRAVDSVSRFVMLAPAQPDSREYRAAFRPLARPECKLLIGGKPIVTGSLTHVSPTTGPPPRVQVEGYGAPGALGDSMLPDNAENRLFRGKTLEAIVRSVVGPWGIRVSVGPGVDVGEPFRKAKIRVGTKVLDFLSTHAADRGVFFRDDESGGLVITDGAPRSLQPVASLSYGVPPYESGEIKTKPQEFYSHVTGFRHGYSGASHTEPNPFVRDVLRPYAWRLERSEGREAPLAVRTKLGRMIVQVLTITVEVATWETPGGALWAPGDLVELHDPTLMVYDPYPFMIREVTCAVASGGPRRASLSLVLPGAFAGTPPDVLPWGPP